jgi:hypothetical protein
MPSRTRLPHRRQQRSMTVVLHGREYRLGVGFDVEARAREVFLHDANKHGSEFEALLQDACVCLSLLLQYGVPASELATKFGREGREPDATAASPIGAVARELEAIERTCGAEVREGYRMAGDVVEASQ